MWNAKGFDDIFNSSLDREMEGESFFSPGWMQEIVQFFVHPYGDRASHGV